MKAIPYEAGRVVVSKQGHDCGRWFLIRENVDEKHVLIVDGDTRKLDKPKKKQTKHLRAKPVRIDELAAAWEADKPVQDSDVRKALAAVFRQEELNAREPKASRTSQKEECALVQE